MKRTSSLWILATESSRLMRGTAKNMGEYILELPPEAIVGRDGVAHVKAFECWLTLTEAAVVRQL